VQREQGLFWRVVEAVVASSQPLRNLKEQDVLSPAIPSLLVEN
jgi:hypothetical protein